MSKNKKMPKWIYAVLAVIVLALIAAGILFATGKIGKGKTTEVPDLLNMSAEEAMAKLEESGLTGYIAETAIDDSVDANTVLKQDPQAGEEADKDSAVALTVSEKSVAVAVADVQDFSQELAKEVLEKQGFTVKVVEEYNSQVSAGAVIKQDVSAGTEYSTGKTVTITVSKGDKNTTAAQTGSSKAETVTVVSVTGKTKQDAKAALQKAGLKMEISALAYSDTVKKGCIISQTPEKDKKAEKGSTVKVVLSNGKKAEATVTVPSVLYRTRSDAKKELEDRGLTVNIIEAQNSKVAKGCVISQSVKAGTSVKMGTKITITVSSGSSSDQNSTTGNKTTAAKPTTVKPVVTTKPSTTKPTTPGTTAKPSTTKETTTRKPIDYEGEKKYIADFRITTDKTSAKAGDVVTVSVALKTNYNIFTIMLPVIYDGNVFEVINTDASNVSSYLTFKGQLAKTYSTNGNWKSPAKLYTRNNNTAYWNTDAVKNRWKIAYASWGADVTKSRTPVKLSSEEVIVTFQLKVKSGVSNTSGRIYISPDFQKTNAYVGGILAVGRCVDNQINPNFVDRGQTINLTNADTKVKIN